MFESLHLELEAIFNGALFDKSWQERHPHINSSEIHLISLYTFKLVISVEMSTLALKPRLGKWDAKASFAQQGSL